MRKSKTGLLINEYKELQGSKYNQQKIWKACKPEHLVDIEKFDELLYNNMDVMGAYNKINPHSKKHINQDEHERQDG
jgi:hypothetical protein